MNSSIPFVFYGNDDVAQEALRALAKYGLVPADKGEVAILVSYGKILSKEEIDSYKYGVLNIHPSMLPLLRGPSPIKSAIIDDLPHTGVSIMRLDGEIDHGPILAQEQIVLSPRIATEAELRTDLLNKGAELLARILARYVGGELTPVEQDHTIATYTHKFKAESALITYPFINAPEVDRKVRALSHEPGTYVVLNTNNGEKRVKLLSGKIESGKYVPTIVQPAGKKPMSWASFLNGNKIL